MDKKSKIFLWVFFLCLFGSIGATFVRVVVLRNYTIEAQDTCDPTTDKCFVYTCDPATEKCTGDPEEDTSYYAIIHRNAKNVPLCDADSDENCKPLQCADGEKDCTVTFCSDETKAPEDTCSDPESYNAEHAATEAEEATTCDPASEDCTVDNAASAATDGGEPVDSTDTATADGESAE